MMSRHMKNKYSKIALTGLSLLTATIFPAVAQQMKIYHQGWIDLDKNGRMDVFENPGADIDKRIADLPSQMTMEENKCQPVKAH
jgi:beta-glucosidase